MEITCTSDGPARHRKAVVFCADDRYLPFALFAAAQIDALHPDRDFDICLATDGDLDIPDSLAHLDVRVCRIGAEGVFTGLRLSPRFTEAVYLRLALPEAFAGEYDRILYLDGDIFVEGGDFSALMGADLGPHAVGAVRDNIQWRWPNRHPRQFRDFGWPSARYLNSGLLLIDVPRWNARQLRQEAVELGRREKDRLRAHDQTLINCMLRGEWAELSPVWNWQYTPKARLFTDLADVHVIHFIRKTKPWRDPDGDLAPRFARALAPFMAAHFPARERPVPGPGPMRRRTTIRQILWYHAIGYWRLARYLDRFPDDMTVHP